MPLYRVLNASRVRKVESKENAKENERENERENAKENEWENERVYWKGLKAAWT